MQCIMNVNSSILHNRKLTVIFNYAYEVIGQGLVSDPIYEYGINQLKELKNTYPIEWAEHDFYRDYFVWNDDWEYTGSGVPRTMESRLLYEDFVEHGRAR